MRKIINLLLTASCLMLLTACGGAANSGTHFSSASAADTQAPTTPGDFAVKRQTSSQINLTWTTSRDNLAVTAYELLRDGELLAHLAPDALEYLDSNLPEGSSHSYHLLAVDAAGNKSQPAILSAKTSALEGGASSSTSNSQASLSASSLAASAMASSSLASSSASLSTSASAASSSSLSSSAVSSKSSSAASSAQASAGSSQSSSQASAARAVENPIIEASWTYCSPQYFGGCSFDGLHEVRFGTGDTWVIKRYLNSMEGSDCNSAVFGEDPAPGEDKHCEYGNVTITGTLAMPSVCHMNEICPQIELTAIPIGGRGTGVLRVKATDEVAPADPGGIGAFRTICAFSHMAFDDPIVYPGQPGASHLHAFFGNTGTNAYSTASSLANSGNSTCLGGIANRSAYWVPALINVLSGKPVVPDDPIWYYKTGYGGVNPADVQAMPAGLRMIAGSMNAAGPQDMVYWDCFETGSARGASIPNCNMAEHVVMSVRFPQCWDGVHLDSVDHKSHMAYPTGSGCPATHPQAIPEITLNVKYLVREQDEPSHWRLSSDKLSLPAGYSAHADWFDGWNNDIRNTWIANCDQAAKDCHAHLLGDGRMLY